MTAERIGFDLFQQRTCCFTLAHITARGVQNALKPAAGFRLIFMGALLTLATALFDKRFFWLSVELVVRCRSWVCIFRDMMHERIIETMRYMVVAMLITMMMARMAIGRQAFQCFFMFLLSRHTQILL